MLLLLPSPLWKNSCFSWNLLNVDWISQSLTLGALSINLLDFFLFTNINFFYQRTSYGVLILFLIMLSEIRLSLLLKLVLFVVLLVTYRSSSPCISWPKSLIANKNFFTSLLRSSLKSSCWKLVSWEKSIPSNQASLCKKTR